MLRLLGLPPRIMLVIILAILAFVIYHVAAVGKSQPLWIIAIVLLSFALIRILYRILRKVPENESESE